MLNATLFSFRRYTFITLALINAGGTSSVLLVLNKYLIDKLLYSLQYKNLWFW